MECQHQCIVQKIEDIPNIDFHQANNGAWSKRWKTSSCKICGNIKKEPVI